MNLGDIDTKKKKLIDPSRSPKKVDYGLNTHGIENSKPKLFGSK